MDRRKFLQNMFGAAVIAAMPKIVVDQIVSLPEPPPISPAINGAVPIFTQKCSIPNGLLYIWDDKKNTLIGASDRFSLEFKQDWIDIEMPSGFPLHYPGLRSWNISASNIQWINDPMESFKEQRKLRCLIAKDNIKINGEIYISQLEITAPQFEKITSAAEFTGNGELIAEVNE